MTSLDAVTRAIVELFEKLGVPYAIMGGMAVRIHALPRPTFDVDFTIAVDRENLPALYAAAESVGFSTPVTQTSAWIDSVRGMPVVKLQWYLGERAIDVDLFLAETPFQRQLLERRQQHGAEGWTGWFVTAEDLILLKLLADRPKDRSDIADILFVQGNLDEAYLRTWGTKLGVEKELEQVLRESRGA